MTESDELREAEEKHPFRVCRFGGERCGLGTPSLSPPIRGADRGDRLSWPVSQLAAPRRRQCNAISMLTRAKIRLFVRAITISSNHEHYSTHRSVEHIGRLLRIEVGPR